MRDIGGFVETRQAMLQAKPNNRNNWITLAVAHHLQANYDVAVRVLEAYEGTLEEVPPNEAYEHSEMLLYKVCRRTSLDDQAHTVLSGMRTFGHLANIGSCASCPPSFAWSALATDTHSVAAVATSCCAPRHCGDCVPVPGSLLAAVVAQRGTTFGEHPALSECVRRPTWPGHDLGGGRQAGGGAHAHRRVARQDSGPAGHDGGARPAAPQGGLQQGFGRRLQVALHVGGQIVQTAHHQ
jgi:hypothetical protein